MTTTMERPQTIQAAIHQDAINRVSEFFNASTRDILNELMQNARRSGATGVEIATGDGWLTVSDDGTGVHDPSAILAFGKTGWEEDSARNEHPAGMGMYSLARCEHVRIISRTAGRQPWRVDLTPDHFVGREAAPVVPIRGDGGGHGTSVNFTTIASRAQVRDTIARAAAHYPLPVRVDGRAAGQEDFLRSAKHVEEWRGIRIGVYSNGFMSSMNFHGIVVQRPKLARVETIDGCWGAQADVVDAPGLELTLPARREVVENAFMAELREASAAAVYRAIAAHHGRVDVPRSVQAHAAELGVELPDAAPVLPRWMPRAARDSKPDLKRMERSPITADAIVVGMDLIPAEEQSLARAVILAGGEEHPFFRADPALEGYGWYDALPRLSGLAVTVADDRGERDLAEIPGNGKADFPQRPERITIRVLTDAAGGGEAEPLILPTDVAFLDDDEPCWDDVNPLVTRDSAISIREMTQLLMDAFFRPDEDSEADSLGTQEDQHESAYERTAALLLSTREDAARSAIHAAVMRHIIHQIPEGMGVTIHAGWNRPLQILLEEAHPEGDRPEGDVPEANPEGEAAQ